MFGAAQRSLEERECGSVVLKDKEVWAMVGEMGRGVKDLTERKAML